MVFLLCIGIGKLWKPAVLQLFCLVQNGFCKKVIQPFLHTFFIFFRRVLPLARIVKRILRPWENIWPKNQSASAGTLKVNLKSGPIKVLMPRIRNTKSRTKKPRISTTLIITVPTNKR